MEMLETVYPGYYVTPDGRVYTAKRNRFLSLFEDKKGYLRCAVFSDGRAIHPRVHRLVAMTYIPNRDNLPQVNHKDGDKKNNHASNLEWTDNTGNIKHAYDTGLLQPYWKGKTGKYHNKSRGVVAQEIETGTMQEYGSAAEAARALGMSRQAVSQVCRGETKQSKGYTFVYSV